MAVPVSSRLRKQLRSARRSGLWAAVLVVVLSVWGLVACGRGGDGAQESAEPSEPVASASPTVDLPADQAAAREAALAMPAPEKP